MTDLQIFALYIVPLILAALGWGAVFLQRWWLKNHPDG